MLYGLTQMEEDFFASKVEKAVLMAPCLQPATLGIEHYLQTYPVFREAGINVVNDANWHTKLRSLCVNDGT